MMKTLLLAAACAAFAAGAEPLRITVLTRLAQAMPEAEQRFIERWGPDRIRLHYGDFEAPPEGWDQADVIFTYLMSREAAARLAPHFRAALARGARVLAHWPEPALRQIGLHQDVELLKAAVEYWTYGGAENLARLLAFLYVRLGGRTDIEVLPPDPAPTAGIYHPEAAAPFLDTRSYLEWYRSRRSVAGDAPVIGILFYHTYLKNRDLRHIDALIAALERHGMLPLAVFGWPPTVAEPYLIADGSPLVEGLFALNLGFARPADADFLARLNVHVVNLMITRQSAAEWSTSSQGLAAGQLGIQVAAPERAGATEPITFATTERSADGRSRISAPIAERSEAAVRRMLRWVALRRKPNSEKRIAILYYNNPPGKGNIGASYLDVPASLAAILQRLDREGYQAGAQVPAERELLAALEMAGRNVEQWAPGELEAIADHGRTVLISMKQYRQWLAATPAEFRETLFRHWGPPERSGLMTIRSRDGEPFCVFPGLRFANVFLAPQPLRSSLEQAGKTQHDTTLPPPHCYVAAYLWLRHVFRADAIVHLGRHGTLEFLPGKNVGLGASDAAEVLLGDVPSPYFYIIDGGGESATARRRGHATLVGHLTPLLAAAGAQEEFRALREVLVEIERVAEGSPALLAEYESRARQEIRRLGLDEQLGLDLSGDGWTASLERVRELLDEIEAGPIPIGLHVLGRLPSEEVQVEALTQFLRAGFSAEELRLLGDAPARWAHALAAGLRPAPDAAWNEPLRGKVAALLAAGAQWLADLRTSPQLELDGFIRVLNGGFLPSGIAGDPLRAPAALPSGRNLHDLDPSLIPTPAACEVGRRFAHELLEQHLRRTGKYPEKVSMVLWYGETIRHQGALECQALHLMGVEPLWNSRGAVDGLRLIPDEELRRPRVDVVVTVSGIYRDGFADKILLLDRAARMVQQAGENVVRRNTLRIADELRSRGLDAATAERAAAARVFGPKPGDYGGGIAGLIKQSRDADDPNLVAEAYLRHNNFAYGEHHWGASLPGALAAHLAGNQIVLHSRTTNLYGVTDNDDFYDFAGGLSLATKTLNGGRAPTLYVANLRRRGREKLEEFRTFLTKELHARLWNPKWIRGMQASGYSGAREIADHLENLYGWQATTPEQVSGICWERTYRIYVDDKLGLGLREFFEKHNPHARQYILARLLEVDRQGTFKFTPEQKSRLLAEYVRSVARFGIGCSANTCGNRRLLAAVLAEARAAVPELAQFRRRLQEALAGPRPEARRPAGSGGSGRQSGRLVRRTWPLPFVEAPMPDFSHSRLLFPAGLAAFALYLAVSGGLGALQALLLRRRKTAIEVLKI